MRLSKEEINSKYYKYFFSKISKLFLLTSIYTNTNTKSVLIVEPYYPLFSYVVKIKNYQKSDFEYPIYNIKFGYLSTLLM